MVRKRRVWSQLWSQPVSISPLCLSSCRDLLGVSTGLAFGPGLHWKPAPWHRLSGMQALSPPEPPCVPRKAEGYFPCSQGSLSSTWPAGQTLRWTKNEVSASPTSAPWDRVHPSTNSLLPKAALLLAGALGKRVASGIIIPLEADAAFLGFDADRQWQQNLTNNKYNPCLCCCKEFNSRWKPRKSFERFLPTKS